MLAVVLLTIVKKVTSANAIGWITNRLKTFSGTVGNNHWVKVWTESGFPDTDYLGKLHKFFGLNFHLRRATFLIINSIALTKQSNVIVYVCQEIVQFMKGTGMTHLIQIDKYIFLHHPELLSLDILKDLPDQWSKVIDRFEKKKSNFLFMKLLYPEKDIAFLNRQNFKVASVIAITCARFYQSTFENYYMDTFDGSQELSQWITRYLQHSQNCEMSRLLRLASKLMSDDPEEIKMNSEKVLEDFVKRYGPPGTPLVDSNNPENMRERAGKNPIM